MACSAGNDGGVFDDGNGEGGSASGGAGGDTGGSDTGGMLNIGGLGGSGPAPCNSGPTDDFDGDGFTMADGDCNDCDANVNPGAIEVIVVDDGTGGGGGAAAEPVDENCNGVIDEVLDPCDAAIDFNDFDPIKGSNAMGLCKMSSGAGDWGLVGAKYTRANGGPGIAPMFGVGVLSNFGPNVNVQEGERMLAISSGAARSTDLPDFCAHSCSGYGNTGQPIAGTPPTGFPQDVPGCAGLTTINDDVALEVILRAPTNATGYSFNFKFYSNEYPEYVCTSFNDQFIALVDPAPTGSINGNISFDSMNNPVSVNVAFFDVCQGCALGTGELEGTDFLPDDGGTSWLETVAPIGAGEEFTIRFAVWDTGDSAWDSTTLIDNFQWIASGGTVAVGTGTVPTPK